MQLKAGTISEMADCIKLRGSKIVMFGAGVIGTSITPAILDALGLGDLVVCCVDNDPEKWGQAIKVGSKTVKICEPNFLNGLGINITILINNSRYADVLDQLERMKCTEIMVCYIVPMIFINSFRNKEGKGVIQTSLNPVIPKKIHYMWLGGSKFSRGLEKCIDSWHKFCPDYEIIRWDESNYDVEKCCYMEQAYRHKKFGFVPDYARLDILYQHGGIYMDTDVELVRNLDNLLYQEAFCSVEKWQVINFGGCSGSVAVR